MHQYLGDVMWSQSFDNDSNRNINIKEHLFMSCKWRSSCMWLPANSIALKFWDYQIRNVFYPHYCFYRSMTLFTWGNLTKINICRALFYYLCCSLQISYMPKLRFSLQISYMPKLWFYEKTRSSDFSFVRLIAKKKRSQECFQSDVVYFCT